jgi:hypothetical protein
MRTTGRRDRWSSSASVSNVAITETSTDASSVASAVVAPSPASIHPSRAMTSTGASSDGRSWSS